MKTREAPPRGRTIERDQKKQKIKVLYIGGYLRIGSTLLDRTLGQIEEFFSAGELRHIWEENFAENQPCGCGTPFADCDFWGEVIDEDRGVGGNPADVQEAIRLKRRVDRMRHIPQLASPWKSPGYRVDLDAHTRNLSRLYSAIKERSGSRVIVDSSKDASYAYALANLEEIELHVVHLVRDSRAVAHSWLRKKLKYEVSGKEEVYMDLRGPAASSVGWTRSNLLVEPLRFYSASYTKVRYEDFIAAPRPTLEHILQSMGEEGRELPFVDDHTLRLGVDHTVAGNPNRFRSGDIELRLDEEWREKMSVSGQRTVTALTWPLLLRYGYLDQANAEVA